MQLSNTLLSALLPQRLEGYHREFYTADTTCSLLTQHSRLCREVVHGKEIISFTRYFEEVHPQFEPVKEFFCYLFYPV